MASRLILVTGANRGIGRRLVERLLLETTDCRVIMTARRQDQGEQALTEIRALGDFQSRILFHPLDILSTSSITQLRHFIQTTTGPLDVLVNNAGVAWRGPEFNEEIARFTLGTNFTATVEVTETLLPVIKPGGHIVMMSSMMGELSRIPGGEVRNRLTAADLTVQGVQDLAAEFLACVADGTSDEKGWGKSTYVISKNLLNAYVRVRAKELMREPERIRLNAMDPGWVKTDMGGPNAPLSLDEGTETALTVVRDLSDSTGQFWSDRQVRPW